MSSPHRSPEWLAFARVQRKQWQARIDSEGVPCLGCRRMLRRGEAWDLGHVVAVRLGGPLTDPSNIWPSCRPCNRADGARISHAIRYRNKRETEREPEW